VRRVRTTALARLSTAQVALLADPFLATSAGAASSVTVVISEIPTQSLVISVDTGGTVTFTNSIPASQGKVSLLGLATVTVATDVTLALPRGTTPDLPGLPAPQLPEDPQAPAPGALPAPGAPTLPGAPTGGTNNTGLTAGEQLMPSAGAPLVLGTPNGFEEHRRTP